MSNLLFKSIIITSIGLIRMNVKEKTSPTEYFDNLDPDRIP